jgi:hypothetical protein
MNGNSNSLSPVKGGLSQRILSALGAGGITTEQKADVLLSIANREPWAQVSAIIEQILMESRRLEYAEACSAFYFSVALEGRVFDCNRVVALLLKCGIKSGSVAYNQLMGICVEKKGVEYQSGYAPDYDPEIQLEIGRLEAPRKHDARTSTAVDVSVDDPSASEP